MGIHYWRHKSSNKKLETDSLKLKKQFEEDIRPFIKNYIIEMPHRTDEEKKEIISATSKILKEFKQNIKRILSVHGELEIRKIDPHFYQQITKLHAKIESIISVLENDEVEIDMRYELIYKTKNGKSNHLLSLYKNPKILDR